jgi:hypothetical protein
VYCRTSEAHVQPACKHGAFEIEHLRPVHHFRSLKTIYANLYWSCRACNQAKGECWPSAEEQKAGWRFLDPCEDALAEHLTLDGNRLVARGGSKAAEYTIETLNLNSAEHVRRRSERALSRGRVHQLGLLLNALPHDTPEAQRRALEDEVADLLARFATCIPWDAVITCSCAVVEAQATARE